MLQQFSSCALGLWSRFLSVNMIGCRYSDQLVSTKNSMSYAFDLAGFTEVYELKPCCPAGLNQDRFVAQDLP